MGKAYQKTSESHKYEFNTFKLIRVRNSTKIPLIDTYFKIGRTNSQYTEFGDFTSFKSLDKQIMDHTTLNTLFRNHCNVLTWPNVCS